MFRTRSKLTFLYEIEYRTQTVCPHQKEIYLGEGYHFMDFHLNKILTAVFWH